MLESVRERRWIVDQNHDGWRLDVFLSDRVPRLSRTQVKRIVRDGGVRLEPSRRAKGSSVLRSGDVVVLLQRFREPLPQDDEVHVLYEDDALIAVDKPAGMLVHPTASVFRNTLIEWGKRTGRDLYVVHRLDRETSGVILFAKSSSVAGRLAGAFADGSAEKRYLAVAVDLDHKFEIGAAGVFDTPLGFDRTSLLPTLMMGRGELEAITHWHCLDRAGDLALFAVRIEGGRQHQIRVHFALAGAPLAGDKLYRHGAAYYLAYCDGEADLSRLLAPRQALHAARLSLPTGAGVQTFESPQPVLFDTLMRAQADTL